MALSANRSGGSYRHRLSAIGWAAALVSGLSAFGSRAFGDEPDFADFPLVIFCNYMDIENAYYFSQLNPDGQAIYLTPDRQIGAITVDGTARRVGGDRSGTCLDKTLDELRGDGQAFDLPH